MEKELSKSQKRVERQKRREERRKERESKKNGAVKAEPAAEVKKKKSLPGYVAKYRHEIHEWLRHYMTLICKADDAGVPYVKNMTRNERNDFIQEYVDISEFLTGLDEYLEEEKEKAKD